MEQASDNYFLSNMAYLLALRLSEEFNVRHPANVLSVVLPQSQPTSGIPVLPRNFESSNLLGTGIVNGSSTASLTSYKEQQDVPRAQTENINTSQSPSSSASSTFDISDNRSSSMIQATVRYIRTEAARRNNVSTDNILMFMRRYKASFDDQELNFSRKCKFCLKNGVKLIAIDHSLKDAGGNVTCPVLYRHVCKICGATGPKAHTWKYCPMNVYTSGDPVAAGMKPGSSRHF